MTSTAPISNRNTRARPQWTARSRSTSLPCVTSAPSQICSFAIDGHKAQTRPFADDSDLRAQMAVLDLIREFGYGPIPGMPPPSLSKVAGERLSSATARPAVRESWIGPTESSMCLRHHGSLRGKVILQETTSSFILRSSSGSCHAECSMDQFATQTCTTRKHPPETLDTDPCTQEGVLLGSTKRRRSAIDRVDFEELRMRKEATARGHQSLSLLVSMH